MPVQLGCCPEDERCLLCPAPPTAPTPELVRALVDRYAEDRATSDLRLGFYGGPPPADALLLDLPFQVRVRPDLLGRREAEHLVRRGAVAFELDVLTFDDRTLRDLGRPYRRALVLEMLEGLRALGARVGVVLAPGLPGTTHDLCLADAALAAPRVDTARLHPVLVLKGARLQEVYRSGLYRPLRLGEAVTVCREMMDVLEAAGVEVIRVGLQPGPDGLGRAVAGPHHPSLRQLVEARRVRDHLRQMLDGTPRGSHIVIKCAPPDETRTRGPLNQHIRDLRAEFGLAGVDIEPDPALTRGEWAISRGDEA